MLIDEFEDRAEWWADAVVAIRSHEDGTLEAEERRLVSRRVCVRHEVVHDGQKIAALQKEVLMRRVVPVVPNAYLLAERVVQRQPPHITGKRSDQRRIQPLGQIATHSMCGPAIDTYDSTGGKLGGSASITDRKRRAP